MSGFVRFLIRRLVHSLITLLAISILVFITIRLSGNPAAAMLASGNATKGAIHKLSVALGLNKPLWVQYVHFLAQALHGNLGISYFTKQPVSGLIASRFWLTFYLAIVSTLFSLAIAIPLGIIAALNRGTLIDLFIRIFSLLGVSFPNFWLGIMMILIFAVDLHWFPASGSGHLTSIVLPALTLGMILAGILARLVRSTLLETLHQDYVRTAHAKGVSKLWVILKHAFRNTLIPLITFIGLQFGTLLGGVVIIENVFAWPGLGQLALSAVQNRDYPIVQGVVIFFAAMLIFTNFLVDVSYAFIDPRIKVGE